MNPFRKYAYSNVWNLGFIRESLDEILYTEHPLTVDYMRHDFKDRWFADPFILDVTDKYIYVLVEEYYRKIRRGRIAKLTVNRDGFILEKSETVLELDTHLSFPAILRCGDKTYIYPESSESGKLNLYEYDAITNKCRLERTLCPEPLTDAIVTCVQGRECIMSTRLPDPNGKVLWCYDKDGSVREYSFEDKTARNAGDWFNHAGQWFRPAQDCNKIYGEAVILQRTEFEGDKLAVKNLRRITSTHLQLNVGCHTFNHYKGVSVIDVKGWWHPAFRDVYENLLKLKFWQLK